MIRTFLLYSIIDRCIDAFFDRIHGAFYPANVEKKFNGMLKVGTKLLRLNVEVGTLSLCQKRNIHIFEDCCIGSVQEDGWIRFTAKRSTHIIEFKTVEACGKFVRLNPRYSCYGTRNKAIKSEVDREMMLTTCHISQITSILHYP